MRKKRNFFLYLFHITLTFCRELFIALKKCLWILDEIYHNLNLNHWKKKKKLSIVYTVSVAINVDIAATTAIPSLHIPFVHQFTTVLIGGIRLVAIRSYSIDWLILYLFNSMNILILLIVIIIMMMLGWLFRHCCFCCFYHCCF